MRRATEKAAAMLDMEAISIHALHEESDQIRCGADQVIAISIHALHEESDD